MSGFWNYFQLQLKRALKLLPSLLTMNLLACCCLGTLAVILLQDGILAENQKKFRIGMVGELEESYLGLQFYHLLRNLDDSRFMVELETMTEEEAAKSFRRGEIAAYLRIPEGLVEALDSGANDQVITYIAGEGQKGISGILAEEIVDEVSVLLTSSQSAVYGMQNLLYTYGKGDRWREVTESLCLRLLEAVLGRTGLCELEILGIGNGLSLEAYYFCSILIFILLLAGIYNSALFVRRNRALAGLVSARGTGAGKQVAGEYLAYVFLLFSCLTVIFWAVGAVMGGGYLVIPEWKRMGAGLLPGFFIRLLPAAAMLAALQFLLYELVAGIVGSVLLQFICAVSMGYLSGCFYPASFFPETVQKIGEFLPSGIALRYTDGCVTGEVSLAQGLGIFLYLLLFLGLSVLIRKRRLAAGG